MAKATTVRFTDEVYQRLDQASTRTGMPVNSIVVAACLELMAELDDGLLDVPSRGVRAGSWSPRTRDERRVATGSIASDQLGHPGFGDAGSLGDVSMTPSFPDHSFHDVAFQTHSALRSCGALCLETSLLRSGHYVVKPDIPVGLASL